LLSESEFPKFDKKTVATPWPPSTDIHLNLHTKTVCVALLLHSDSLLAQLVYHIRHSRAYEDAIE
jgi:hypothetical protein